MEFNLCSWWHSDLTAKGKCNFFPGIMAEMRSVNWALEIQMCVHCFRSNNKHPIIVFLPASSSLLMFPKTQ